MLRLFRDVLEEKEISDEEFDGMIDLLYEREGAYADAQAELTEETVIN